MITQAQLDAILHGAAIAPLNNRAFLRITGTDATRWLNGMVTNSIQDLAPGEGNYNFLLNAQGRIQGDCMIYREPSEGDPTFLLETDTTQLETINQLLDKFIIMDDVELTPAMSEHNGSLLIGLDATKLVDTFHVGAGAALRMFEFASAENTTTVLLSPSFSAVPQFELFDMGHVEFPATTKVSPEALEAFRIYSGTPKYGTDIRAKDLPQETNQPHALHFNKGCYLGQEIVERIRSRGQVHRLLTKFILTGTLPTELPTPLTSSDKPAGELTSAAQIGDKIYALGYARREFLDTKATFTYPGGNAIPQPASET
jgi:folate-binding protein YgfZ